MKEGTSLDSQIRWQKKVIGNQVKRLKDQEDAIIALGTLAVKQEKRIKELEDSLNQMKGSMALESSKFIDSLELKDQRIKELEEELRSTDRALKELMDKI